MKKLTLALISSTIIGYASLSFAEDMEIKLNGSFNFQVGHVNLNVPKPYTGLSTQFAYHGCDVAFNTSANIGLNVVKDFDNGIKLGAQIGLETTTKSSRASPSFIFFESEGGKFEYGSGKSVVSNMMITASKSCADPGPTCWNSWINIDPEESGINKVPFLMCTSPYLDNKTRISKKTEYSRKMTYYSPKLRGFQFGISYIPDASNSGNTNFSENNKFAAPTNPGYDYTLKDGIGLGLTYENKISSDVLLRLSLTGEHAKVKKFVTTAQPHTPLNVTNLNTISYGASLNYQKFSFSASYTDYLKSLTQTTDSKRNSHIVTVGGGYKFDKLKLSLSHFFSHHRGNKLNATTFSAEYKLAPGILPYASISYITAKGSNLAETREISRKGTIALVGTKLTF